ncbi:hypothetical protein N6H14_03255 [Paenibacillus sp. CC-CFT747]|nr:hypothetical protein N6H14_03255 [Paenibacillus sp. CC-CFT747]
MKKICLVLSLLLATVPLSACGSSDPTSNSDNGTTLGEGSGKTIDSGATSPDPGSGKPTPTPKRQEGTADNPLTGTTPKASGSPGGASASPSPAGKSVSADLLNTKGRKWDWPFSPRRGTASRLR